MDIEYRNAKLSDALKLSILFKQVYIATYGTEGVSDEFANFITQQFSVERLENIIANQPERLIVAVYKDNLVGVAKIDFDKKIPIKETIAPELNKLYILEWFGGKGIGKNLLSEVEKTILSKGLDKIYLEVWAHNPKAISFYEKNGFKPIGKVPFQMEVNTYENIVMMKEFK